MARNPAKKKSTAGAPARKKPTAEDPFVTGAPPEKAPPGNAVASAYRAEKVRGSAKATAPRTSPQDAGRASLPDARSPQWAQQGDVLTTVGGTPVEDSNNSLRAGPRGSTLLEDHHLREKIMHFDHERIPERVVHARGAGAHGTFTAYESLADVTSAVFLSAAGLETPVFTRFSTVAGSRGSADTARDVRGFAVKFYTDEGNFDLVGNNIPIFFIQDGIKFPDLIHAAKPEPDREIPQAQTAHDTFWDFASLTPESTAMLMWIMSDRAIPRSYRTMEGFGVHTFRLVNEAGETSLVKFHWKPVLGVHSLVWEESQRLGGIDPDFHRRDLWNAIEAEAYPEWELGLQIMEDTEDQTFGGIDLLDPTKIVPEELVPVRPVGRLRLDRNPTNFFAETEQIAFDSGHLVRGIDVTDDPLLHARLFSYLDTQLTRLGGPNFAQIPINRSHTSVNDNLRDGFMQQAVPEGRAAYVPNSIGGGCPFAVGDAGYVHVPRAVDGVKKRERAQSFADHFSQATLFWTSMSPTERDHIVGAFAFELGKCEDLTVIDRMLGNLANVDAELCALVAEHVGRPAPDGNPDTSGEASPALSMMPTAPGPIDGRAVGLVIGEGTKAADVRRLDDALDAAGAVLHVIAAHGGEVSGVAVHKTFHTVDSVEFDALVLAPSAVAALAAEPKVAVLAQEVFRHHKTVAAWGAGSDVLDQAGIAIGLPGVVHADNANAAFAKAVVEAVGWHRHWDR